MINKIIIVTIMMSVIVACTMSIVILLFKWFIFDKKKRGVWLYEEPHSIYDFYTCSKCGDVVEYKTKYCAHCGARMKNKYDE